MIHNPHRTHGAPSGQASTPAAPDEIPGERVAKALARAGVASRRDIERMIAEGRVAVNGKVLTTPAVKVEPGDILTVDGKVMNAAEPARLFRYHKPVGLLTAHKDPKDRPTVFAALPDGLPRLISVGRLDINSEGLLLLTNDGDLARGLELPATGIQRRYRARALGRVTQEKLDTLKAGVVVEGIQYGPIEATLDKAKEGPRGANLWITVTLAEGKNREVRRVLESLDLKVNRLIRLSYGPLALGTLGPGAIEEVGPRVVREQFADHIAPANLPTGDRTLFKPSAGVASRRAQDGGAERRPGRNGPPPRGHKGEQPAGPRRASTEEKPKKEHKPGWAKAKPKLRAHPVAKAGGGMKKSAGPNRQATPGKPPAASRPPAPKRPR